MAIDTWKIQSDETQRFILGWLGEITDTVMYLTNDARNTLRNITVKTPEEHVAIADLCGRIDRLGSYQVKHIPLPSVDD